MIGKTWNNGEYHQSGAGYGIQIKKPDRDSYFNRDWGCVSLELEGENDKVEVNIDKDSFWEGDCLELIKQEIGIWLIKNGKGTWPEDHPYEVKLEPDGEKHLKVTFVK